MYKCLISMPDTRVGSGTEANTQYSPSFGRGGIISLVMKVKHNVITMTSYESLLIQEHV